jgi:DNA-binding NarL/FixJ family response regulator
MLKFLIVDDHSIFRQGVKKIIADKFTDVLFGEANNSAEALGKLFEQQWDLVVLDISMPGRSGLDFICDIQLAKYSLPILVLSMYEEGQIALRALKAGATGYLSKSKAATELVTAITKILEGKQYISETTAELLVNEYRKDKHKLSIKDLSDREYFVMLRLANGETVTEISHKLMLSPKTISTYRSRIMKKLDLKNNVQLFSFLKENNFF